jgi:3'-phosphoadenosine 5'-phosphosulfate sulfotransferase
MTGNLLDGWEIRVKFLGGARDFTLLHSFKML